MHYTPKTLSEPVVEMAAEVAPTYGISIKDVAELMEVMKFQPVPTPSESAAIMAQAEPIRAVIFEMAPQLEKLRRLFEAELFYRDDAVSSFAVPVLASAVAVDRIDVLHEFQAYMRHTADKGWMAYARSEVENPRRALILANMTLAGQFWFDHGDEFPDGEMMMMTAEGWVPTPGSGLAFIYEVVEFVHPDVSAEEFAENVQHMRDHIGMTAYLEDVAEEEAAEQAEREARRAHLRVVK